MKRRAFTLIEILVAVGIIAVLATIMVAVGSSVQKNARINETRVTLKAIEGMIEKYETETNTTLLEKVVVVAGVRTSYPVGTVYTTDGASVINQPSITTTSVNFVDILQRHPATKEMIAKLGNKIKTNTTASGTITYIVDSWGNPIHYFSLGWVPGSVYSTPTFPSDYSASPRMHLRSSGPDKQSDFTTSSNSNNSDDIFSYEP